MYYVLWIACLCNNMQNIVQMVTVELYVFCLILIFFSWAVLQDFCVQTMCCMSIILSCVFPSDWHFELIKVILHTFKAIKFLFSFLLSQVFTIFFKWSLSLKDSWLIGLVSCIMKKNPVWPFCCWQRKNKLQKHN